MSRQEIKVIFAKRFYIALMTSGKTCKQLADHLGINERTVKKYLHGITVPSTKRFYLIAKFLDVSCDYLIGRSDI